MIARWKRALMRWLLAQEIAGMETDLAAIAAQRKNDEHAAQIITRELAVARRQAQALAFKTSN